MFVTRRHVLIQEIGPNRARPWGPLHAERDLQLAALEELTTDLKARRARAFGGEPAVLEHPVYYQRPDNSRWPEVLSRPHVRLVVPLRVIEELDAKKYSGNGMLSDRARNILPWLEDRILRAGGRIRDDTTIEVPIDHARRPRPADADREILDECEELYAFGGQGVTLVTTDTALRLRAHAAGIPTARLDPEKHGRSLPG